MSNPEILNDILAHTDKGKLSQFIRDYAAENEDFRSVFMNRFSPKPKRNGPKCLSGFYAD